MILSEEDALLAVDPRHWRVVDGRLETRVSTGTFLAGLDLVTAVAEIAERLGHHPDILLTYPHVLVTSVSHDVGGLTEREWVIRAWHSPAASPSVKWSRFWWRRAMGRLGDQSEAWPWKLGRMVPSASMQETATRDEMPVAAGRRGPAASARRWQRHLARVLGA